MHRQRRSVGWRSERVINKDQCTCLLLRVTSLCLCVCVRFQGTIDEMKRQEVNLREQMREQCDDYKRLLAEKMGRDMEIAAYR